MNRTTNNADMNRKRRKQKTKKVCSFHNWAQFVGQLSITVAIAIYAIIENNGHKSIAEENRRQDILTANETRYKDLGIAESNRLNDIFLSDNQQKEDILRDYQNFMTDLFLKYGLYVNDSAVRFSIRYKTLAALEQLNPTRRTFPIQSLIEANLITYNDELESSLLSPIIKLNTGNLTEIYLGGTSALKTPRFCLAFDDTVLNRASFYRTNLYGSTFINAKLNDADFSFSESMLPDDQCSNRTKKTKFSISFYNAEMYYTNLSGIVYDDIDFSFANMINVDMSYATLSGQLFFSNTQLNNSQLYKTQFIRGTPKFAFTNMIAINGTRATFDNSLFYQARLINCSLINSIITNSQFPHSDLTNCQLNNAQLTNVKFINTILVNVNMNNLICLANCSFFGANLTGVSLQNATIMKSNLRYANFTDQQIAQARSFVGSILPNGTVVPMNN